MSRRVLCLPVLLALLVGCGTEVPRAQPAEGERVPITQRAIAAIALEHLPEDTTLRQATYTDKSDVPGTLGADLRYGGDGEYDGDLVRVVLAPTPGDGGCGDVETCEQLDTEVEGATLWLSWGIESPEEDPGAVSLLLQRDGETATVHYSGPVITKDPRKMDLPIGLQQMVEVLEDPRLLLQTSTEAVEEGEQLDEWGGHEPDPHAYDPVPATDVALTSAYLLSRGGYISYADPRTSPLKGEFGSEAVGGRLTHDADKWAQETVVDVFAAPQPPPWLAEVPCRTERFRGHCEERPATLGPQYLAWVPGTAESGGEVWMMQIRRAETVAVRYAGWDVPESLAQVEEDVEWYLQRELLDSRQLGLTLERRVLDFDLEELKQQS